MFRLHEAHLSVAPRHSKCPVSPWTCNGSIGAKAWPTHTEVPVTLSPDTFEFKLPTDFASYIQQRHPGLQRTYYIDYIKNHNSLMIREIFDMWSSIMRRNAQLIDWLVDQFGAKELQMMHTKPGSSPSPVAMSNSSTHLDFRGQDTPLPPKVASGPSKRSSCPAELTPAKKFKSCGEFGVNHHHLTWVLTTHQPGLHISLRREKFSQ